MDLSTAKTFFHTFGRYFFAQKELDQELSTPEAGPRFQQKLLLSNITNAIQQFRLQHNEADRNIAIDSAQQLYLYESSLENLTIMLGTYDEVGLSAKRIRERMSTLTASVPESTPQATAFTSMRPREDMVIADILQNMHTIGQKISDTSEQVELDLLRPKLPVIEQQIMQVINVAQAKNPIEQQQHQALAYLLMGNITLAMSHLETAEQLLLKIKTPSAAELEQLVVIQHRKVALLPKNITDNNKTLTNAKLWIDQLAMLAPDRARLLELDHLRMIAMNPDSYGIVSGDDVHKLWVDVERKADAAIQIIPDPTLQKVLYLHLFDASASLMEEALESLLAQQEQNEEFKLPCLRGRQKLQTEFTVLLERARGKADIQQVHEFIARSYLAFAFYDYHTEHVESALGFVKSVANTYANTVAGQMILQPTFWTVKAGLTNPDRSFVSAATRTTLSHLDDNPDDAVTACSVSAVAFGLGARALGGPVGMGMTWGCGSGIVASRLGQIEASFGPIRQSYRTGLSRFSWEQAGQSLSQFALQTEISLLSMGAGVGAHLIVRRAGEWGITRSAAMLTRMGIESTPWVGQVARFTNRHVIAYTANAGAMHQADHYIGKLSGQHHDAANFWDTFIRIRTLGFMGEWVAATPLATVWDRTAGFGWATLSGVVASETAIEKLHPSEGPLNERIAHATFQMFLMHGFFSAAGVYRLAATPQQARPEPIILRTEAETIRTPALTAEAEVALSRSERPTLRQRIVEEADWKTEPDQTVLEHHPDAIRTPTGFRLPENAADFVQVHSDRFPKVSQAVADIYEGFRDCITGGAQDLQRAGQHARSLLARAADGESIHVRLFKRAFRQLGGMDIREAALDLIATQEAQGKLSTESKSGSWLLRYDGEAMSFDPHEDFQLRNWNHPTILRENLTALAIAVKRHPKSQIIKYLASSTLNYFKSSALQVGGEGFAGGDSRLAVRLSPEYQSLFDAVRTTHNSNPYAIRDTPPEGLVAVPRSVTTVPQDDLPN